MAERVVYKFPVEASRGFGPVHMQDGAEIVHVDHQPFGVFVWAVCDPDAPLVTRLLGIFGTGFKVPADGVYIGTAKQGDGAFMWHVFESEAS